ncbi:unnamed protein product [Aureobasidium vineae]|uniref:Small ribosomal subunit protein mS23 n=1 Tax=Aureobasidium vineae TaxID=2773715 RepID=A0A9N8K0V5_9PEZI|nr:unnamed protein product [Aureobasidium vineae]
MGRYNFAPQRVHQAATRLLQVRNPRSPSTLQPPPPWYTVIGNLPPSERLVRPPLQPAQRKGRKASKLFQPVKLQYQEDQLRLDFFGDHPWELARPRQVLEDDGKDYQKFDWSQLDQPTKQVDGESVVQRQAWLMGLLRHELDFSASSQLLDYLRSDALQDELLPLFREEYAVDLQSSQLPSRTDYTDADASVPVNLYMTYHPKYPHQFKDALKHLNQILAEQGLDTSSVNKRSFNIALLHSDAVAQTLRSTDLAAIGKQYNVVMTLEPEATIKPFAEDPFNVLPISLSYYRNASANVSALLNHLATTVNIKTTDILSPTLPTAEPDTYQAYTKAGAYDKARKEFYDVRHTQDIERRVAREEALWTGAEFGPSPLDVGMQLEDQKYEEWREWAAKEIMAIKQLSGSSARAGDQDALLDVDSDQDVLSALDEVEPSVPGSKKGQNAQGGAFVHA